MTYAGRSLSLKPDEKLAGINESCKNHLINSFGPRGLVALAYSDVGKENEIGDAGRELNLRFKKRQIRIYNETNEQRKLGRLGYLSPTKKIKEYAVELGMELLEPYNLKDEEKAAIAKSTNENALLRQELEELRNMIKSLSGEVKPRLTGAQRTLRGEGG